MTNIFKIHIFWKKQIKSRLPLKFRIFCPFGSTFILEGLWTSVRACVRVLLLQIGTTFLPKVVFFPGYSLKNYASNGTKHVFLWILPTYVSSKFYQTKMRVREETFFDISIFFCLPRYIIFFISECKTKENNYWYHVDLKQAFPCWEQTFP